MFAKSPKNRYKKWKCRISPNASPLIGKKNERGEFQNRIFFSQLRNDQIFLKKKKKKSKIINGKKIVRKYNNHSYSISQSSLLPIQLLIFLASHYNFSQFHFLYFVGLKKLRL